MRSGLGTISCTGMGLLCVAAFLGCSALATDEHDAKVVVSALPTTLDWSTSDPTSWVNFPVMLATQKGLTALGAGNAPVPALAASWERSVTSEGHERYVFHLRTDVTWSDGVPLEARDFVVAWRRAVQGAEGGELSDLEHARDILARKTPPEALGARALDPHTLEVTLESPRNYFLARVANVYLYFPAPAHDLEGLSAPQQREYFDRPRDGKPRALGPFRVESWDRAGERLRLVRNPRSAFAPQLAPGERAVEGVTLLRSEIGLTLFERQRVDFIAVDDVAALAAGGHQGLSRQPLLSTYFLAFNTEVSPLDDVQVRQAISLAVDRGALLAGLLPAARPSATLVPPELALATDSASAAAWLRPDLAHARALLAGKPGLERPLRLVYHAGSSFIPEVAIAERLAEQLRALGFQVTPEPRQDFSAELARERPDGKHAYDLYLKRVGADYAHPNSFFALFRRNGNHQTGWEHLRSGAAMARFEFLLAQGDAAPDLATARARYAEAEALLVHEQAVLVPLYHPDRYFRRSPRVAGLGVDAFNFLSLGELRWGAP